MGIVNTKTPKQITQHQKQNRTKALRECIPAPWSDIFLMEKGSLINGNIPIIDIFVSRQ